MKQQIVILLLLLFSSSCVNNPLDSKQEDHLKKARPLSALVSKSGTFIQEDSLTMMSNLQKDVNHLMMNRIIFKDSMFVLAIRRQDAQFLGVPDDVYDSYVEYVESLNKVRSNQ